MVYGALLVGLGISVMLGSEAANSQIDFLVLNTLQKKVVIRNYNDILFCKNYVDEKNNNIGDTLYVIKISDTNPFTLTKQKLSTTMNLYEGTTVNLHKH